MKEICQPDLNMGIEPKSREDLTSVKVLLYLSFLNKLGDG